MEDIFDAIVQHFATKNEYIRIFGQYLIAMEHWIRGEIVWLTHQPPFLERGVFVATNRGKGPRPDLEFRLYDRKVNVELKAVVIDPDSSQWDYVAVQTLKSGLETLVSGEADWLISVTYPLVGFEKWRRILADAISKANFDGFCIKEESFDIDEDMHCLVSLFEPGLNSN